MSKNLRIFKDIQVVNIDTIQLMYYIGKWCHYINVPRYIVVRRIFGMDKNPPNNVMEAQINGNIRAFEMIEEWLSNSEIACTIKWKGQYTVVDQDEKIFRHSPYERFKIQQRNPSYFDKEPIWDGMNISDVIGVISKITNPSALMMMSKSQMADAIVFSTPSTAPFNERQTCTLKELFTIYIKDIRESNNWNDDAN